MKITREINGVPVEIELTPAELGIAYFEAQIMYDQSEIDYHLEEYEDDPVQFERDFGLSLKTFRANCIPDAGKRLRRWLERYEDSCSCMWDAREESVHDAAKAFLNAQKSA